MTFYLGSDWVSSSRHPQPQPVAVRGLRTLTPFISSSPPPDVCNNGNAPKTSFIIRLFFHSRFQLKIKGIEHIITTLDTNTNSIITKEIFENSFSGEFQKQHLSTCHTPEADLT